MNRALVAVLLAFLVGCFRPASIHEQEDIGSNITFFREPRSGLCFAVLKRSGEGSGTFFSIAHVPCESVPAGIPGGTR